MASVCLCVCPGTISSKTAKSIGLNVVCHATLTAIALPFTAVRLLAAACFTLATLREQNVHSFCHIGGGGGGRGFNRGVGGGGHCITGGGRVRVGLGYGKGGVGWVR